jgi:uncharacterized membrane protein
MGRDMIGAMANALIITPTGTSLNKLVLLFHDARISGIVARGETCIFSA